MPHGVTPPEQLLSVPMAVVPFGSAAVRSQVEPAAGPVKANGVRRAVMRRLYGRRLPRTGRHWPVCPTRSSSTTDSPCAAIAVSICPTVIASSVVKPGNISSSLVYSWLTTSSARFPSRPSGRTPTKSLLKPNCRDCRSALCRATSRAGAPGSTGSPQRMTTAVSYPFGTTRLSSLLGGIGLNVSAPARSRPAAGAGPAAGTAEGTAAAGVAAAAEPPKPSTIAPIAPARTTPRRLRPSRTTSPRYGLPDSFGTGWSHALPQR
ncbi:hypothetical protein Asp14428_04670 [Actinoplanes sp. NBRC 14428]|nr:hypothetical protein Asp14428_04670 [Actinoplanes sp. NBRC 14428]